MPDCSEGVAVLHAFRRTPGACPGGSEMPSHAQRAALIINDSRLSGSCKGVGQVESRDTTDHYGTISRALHWGMALLITWQFTTAGARVLAEDSPLDEFLWATHKPLGVLLLLLVLIRVAWSLSNAGHRPGPPNVIARLGHLTMYALIIIIPILALIRQYGSGRTFSPFGLPLMSGFEGSEIEWLMAPANLFHGWLGWLLLMLIAGHILMTFIHRRRPGDEDVLRRMIGKR